MFKPTEFPCTAWRITPELNVLETRIVGFNKPYYSRFCDDGYGMYYSDDLFATKHDAVRGATVKLQEFDARLKRAIQRQRRRTQMVAHLQAQVLTEGLSKV